LRAVVLVACALVAALFAVVPGPGRSPLGRLVNPHADGPGPRFDTPVDGGGLRRAGEALPDETTYFLYAPGASPLLQGNLKAAAQLFLAPALPVQTPAAAHWVVAYGPRIRAPIGTTVRKTRRIDRVVSLVELSGTPR
jgi:hypothetical protein